MLTLKTLHAWYKVIWWTASHWFHPPILPDPTMRSCCGLCCLRGYFWWAAVVCTVESSSWGEVGFYCWASRDPKYVVILESLWTPGDRWSSANFIISASLVFLEGGLYSLVQGSQTLVCCLWGTGHASGGLVHEAPFMQASGTCAKPSPPSQKGWELLL